MGLSFLIIRIGYLVLCAAALALVFLLVTLPDGRFHVYFLDIGQGDSILIVTPQQHTILIDGGPDNEVVRELSAVLPFFQKSIDMVILSHPHKDHVAGLTEVVRRFEVKRVMFTGVQAEEAAYAAFLEEATRKNIPVVLAESSRDFSAGGVHFDVLYPFRSLAGMRIENLNNSSVALRVQYGDIRVLLTGDLEKEIESLLVDKAADQLSTTIYKAGHHGSRTSSTSHFLARASPRYAVVQSGHDNQFGHPHPETLRAFFRAGVEKIFRNDLQGRVEFVY